MNERERFDKFTERARKVLRLAQEEAYALNHDYIGTEHLLLGLVREGDGVAAKVLRDLGLQLDQVRAEIEQRVGKGDHVVQGDVGLTPGASKVIELAADEARRLNHNYIGTEHLLQGLVREEEGIGAQVLATVGLHLETVRRQVVEILNPSGPAGGKIVLLSRSSSSAATDTSLKRSTTPALDQLAIDLTELARQGRLDQVSGHDLEVEHLIQILSRRERNTAIVIHESAIRRTAIVLGLARRMVSHQVPETLQGKRLLMVTASLLVAGSTSGTQFEARVKTIVEEARSSRDCIIFIDEVQSWLGAGAAGEKVDVRNIIVPALARGEIQLIGATTVEDYRTYIEKDQALQRRVLPVIVPEVTLEENALGQAGPGDASAESKQEQHFWYAKLTDQYQSVLSLAREEADRFNHNYIGTEHLLLGLVREGDGVAAKVLGKLGVDLDKVRDAVEFIVGRGARSLVSTTIDLTPRSKQVIKLAADEARRLNHHYVGTEHLLLGLVREGEGIAAGVLESLGANLETVRTHTIQALNQNGDENADGESRS